MNKNLLIFLIFSFSVLSNSFSQRKLPKNIHPGSSSIPSPIVKWDFNKDFRDLEGVVESKLVGDAKVEDGFLVLESNNCYLKTESLPVEIFEKTIVAQVQISDLDQRGGGVVTVQSLNGAAFDSLVFAELKPKTWMNGSEYFVRAKGDEGKEENDRMQLIHLAISYDKEGKINIFRNGVLYRSTFQTKTPVQVFRKNDSNILIGIRHEGGGNNQFKGKIDFVEIYDEVLSQDQVNQLYRTVSQNK
jgi:hypothetical protein